MAFLEDSQYRYCFANHSNRYQRLRSTVAYSEKLLGSLRIWQRKLAKALILFVHATGQGLNHGWVAGQGLNHSWVAGQGLNHSWVAGQGLNHGWVAGQGLNHGWVAG
jgi:hypothetical protein